MTAEIRSFLKQQTKHRSIQNNALIVLPWYLVLLLHSYFRKNETHTYTFFLESEKIELEKIKFILEETRAKISMLVYMTRKCAKKKMFNYLSGFSN